MAKTKHRVVWFDMGFLPWRVGFCPSKKAWEREMKRLDYDSIYPNDSAGCAVWLRGCGHGRMALVTISKSRTANDSSLEIVSKLAHEGAHIWQYIREGICEDRPSPEFEAYAVQHITRELIKAFSKTRFKLTTKP